MLVFSSDTKFAALIPVGFFDFRLDFSSTGRFIFAKFPVNGSMCRAADYVNVKRALKV